MSRVGDDGVVGQYKPVRIRKLEKPYGTLDENGVLWNSDSVGKFVSTMSIDGQEIKTIQEVAIAFEKFSDRPAVGQRPLVNREMIEDPKNPKKKFEKLTLGPYQWMTYAQWGERIRQFGSGMVQVANLKAQDRVLIYAETQRDWMTTAFAAFNHNLTIVTAYATLGADAAAFAINLSKATAVVADAKLLKVLLPVVKDCPNLKNLITITDVEDETRTALTEAGVTVSTFNEVIVVGKDTPVDLVVPSPDDLAIIMFTSGTTGTPKGVRMLHRNVIAASAGARHLLESLVTPDDVYPAYLPLAHIMEILSEINMVAFGTAIGYGSPHTLTDTSVKVAPGASGDLTMLKPTVVVFAPLVLEKVYNGINAKVRNASGFRQWLFGLALNSGASNFEADQVGANGFWNAVVFKKVQQMVGGRLRLVLTGSAPLDGNVHKFVQSCFGCPVRQGFGSTETCAASHLQVACDNRVASVGPPVVSCCTKLVNWEEGGYLISDKDNPEIGMSRGEIVLGGPAITDGYLVDPEDPDEEIVKKNASDFKDEDGVRWFYTGDIGQLDADGCLAIIDRKKDLVKLQNGEYVALSKVEGVLKLSKYVENAMVHVSSSQKFCTALVCPVFPELRKLCEENGWTTDMDEACANENVVNAVLASCREVARGKLAGFEIPTKVFLVPEERVWTPENDLLTSAMKLKRKPIINAHQAEIDAFYA